VILTDQHHTFLMSGIADGAARGSSRQNNASQTLPVRRIAVCATGRQYACSLAEWFYSKSDIAVMRACGFMMRPWPSLDLLPSTFVCAPLVSAGLAISQVALMHMNHARNCEQLPLFPDVECLLHVTPTECQQQSQSAPLLQGCVLPQQSNRQAAPLHDTAGLACRP
jgi:hypothetical protein